ncbi:MAG: hypothetical protein V1913_02300 [Fibrobacterota bacterium]
MVTFRVRRPWHGLALVLLLAALAGSITLTTSGEYLFDNTVFSRRIASLSVQGLTLPLGTLGCEASYGHSELNQDINGLRKFDDTFMSGTLKYRYHGRSFSTGADVSAGSWMPGDDGRFFVSGSLPFEWKLPWSGLRLLTQLALREGVANDNPALTRIGSGKRTLKADAGLGIRGWELHAAYQEEEYSSIRRNEYQPLLADTAFFQAFYDILNPVLKFIKTPTDPVPSNEISQISVYGFGPVGSMFYMGGSYIYRNALNDFYLPVADLEDSRIVNAFFPYITPSREKVVFLITAFAQQWQSSGAYLNNVFVKLDFPIYSTGSYRGYYQANPKNLLAGYQGFFYDYKGLGTLTLETELGKKLGREWGISLRHKWTSRPYIAYRYFGNDAYQYHTITAAITKEL